MFSNECRATELTDSRRTKQVDNKTMTFPLDEVIEPELTMMRLNERL